MVNQAKPDTTNNLEGSATKQITGPGAKLIRITNELADLIHQETALLEQKRPHELNPLQGQKMRLMAQYQEAMNNAKVNENLLGKRDSHIRKSIKEATVGLREELKKHARIVIRMKTITEGILKSVGDEVAKRNRPSVGYGEHAQMNKPYTVRPTSLSLNQII